MGLYGNLLNADWRRRRHGDLGNKVTVAFVKPPSGVVLIDLQLKLLPEEFETALGRFD